MFLLALITSCAQASGKDLHVGATRYESDLESINEMHGLVIGPAEREHMAEDTDTTIQMARPHPRDHSDALALPRGESDFGDSRIPLHSDFRPEGEGSHVHPSQPRAVAQLIELEQHVPIEGMNRPGLWARLKDKLSLINLIERAKVKRH